jgi:aminoglycoside phosphotransferase (APT) family kinase protein
MAEADEISAGRAPESGLESGLRRIAARISADAAGATGLRRLSGGATQEIWRFDLVTGAAPAPAILRCAPGGREISGFAVGPETEAALIRAAEAAGVPVPPVHYVLRPEDGLGQGFVMGFVEGETLGGRIVKSEAFAAIRPLLARQCGRILARIHSIDPNEFPNLERTEPQTLISRWLDAYRATARPRPVFELAFRWLARHCPPPPRVLHLVHGDFRNGNLIVGPDGVRAVLDWELAHVGDPMEDLGWICVNSWRFGRVDKVVGGFGDLDDLLEGYAAAGGAAIDRAAAKWWQVLGSLKWGVMCAGMAAMFRTVDPTVERAVIARRASETEIDLMRLLAG